MVTVSERGLHCAAVTTRARYSSNSREANEVIHSSMNGLMKLTALNSCDCRSKNEPRRMMLKIFIIKTDMT